MSKSEWSYANYILTFAVAFEVIVILTFVYMTHFMAYKPILQPDLFHFSALSIGIFMLSYLTPPADWGPFISLLFSSWVIFELSLNCNYELWIDSSLLTLGDVQLTPDVTRHVISSVGVSIIYVPFHRVVLLLTVLLECARWLSTFFRIMSGLPCCATRVQQLRSNEYHCCGFENWRGRRCTPCWDCCPTFVEDDLEDPKYKLEPDERCESYFIRDFAKFCLFSSFMIHVFQAFVVTWALHLRIPYWTYSDSIMVPLILAELLHCRLIFKWVNRNYTGWWLYYIITIVFYLSGLVLATWGLCHDRDKIQSLGNTWLSKADYWSKFSTGTNFGGYGYVVNDSTLQGWFGRLSYVNHIFWIASLIFGYMTCCIFIWDFIRSLRYEARNYRQHAGRKIPIE